MNRLLVPIVALLTICQTGLEAKVPRVLILLTVEELRTDLLEELRPHLSKEGLGMLLDRGATYTHIYSPLLHPDRSAAEAMIHTGTTPLYNGIPASYPTQRVKGGGVTSHRSAFQDDAYIGFATTERRSPKALTAPSISDKLKSGTKGKAVVVSIAPHSEEAIIAGGQNGDIVLWLDDFTAKWVSSTYYKGGYPWYVDKYNSRSQSPGSSISNIRWEPLYKAEADKRYVAHLPAGSEGESVNFNHNFGRSNAGIAQYKTSGLVNEAIADLTSVILESSTLGADETPDLLSIHLYAGGYLESDEEITPEILDNYYRLDRAVAQIIREAEKKAGAGNVAVALCGNGVSKEYYTSLPAVGTFYMDRCKALLNMYLMAKFGRQNWVREITPDGQIYFDRELVEKSKIDLADLQDKTADFMLEFSGVAYAVPDHSLRKFPFAPDSTPELLSCLNKGTHAHRGDVLFEILPGWRIQQDQNHPIQPHLQYTMVQTAAPFILYTGEAKGESIETPRDLRTLSTDICHVLRIRPPTPGLKPNP